MLFPVWRGPQRKKDACGCRGKRRARAIISRIIMINRGSCKELASRHFPRGRLRRSEKAVRPSEATTAACVSPGMISSSRTDGRYVYERSVILTLPALKGQGATAPPLQLCHAGRTTARHATWLQLHVLSIRV